MIDFIGDFFAIRTGAIAAACLAFTFLVLAVHSGLELRSATDYGAIRRAKASAVLLSVGAVGSGITWAVLQNFPRHLGGNDSVTVLAYIAGAAVVFFACVGAWEMVTSLHAWSAVAGTLTMLVASIHVFVTMLAHAAYNTRRSEMDNLFVTTLRQLEFATRVLVVLLVIAAVVLLAVEFFRSRRDRQDAVSTTEVEQR